MATENRYSVKFTFISLLGPLAAIGLIFAAIVIAFLTINTLNSNPAAWVCLGVLVFLLCCFFFFSYLIAKRLNPFEYDSNFVYARKSILGSGDFSIGIRGLKEVLYSQNFIDQIAGTGTIVLTPQNQEQAQIKLRGVPDVKSTAGTLEKLRLAKQ